MTKPTIHLNGTSGKELLAQYRNAMEALSAADKALAECGPNARDYYVQSPEAYTTARDEHYARREKLQAITDEITALAVHCMETDPRRDR